jgi:glucose/arabinose dehydrogenase
MRRLILTTFAALLLFAARPARANYVFPAFPGLSSFSSPTGVEDPMDGTDRLFVVERAGTIQVFQNDPTTRIRSLFLDISADVTTATEGGLLGLAFHPQYETNRFFYVVFTAANPTRTVLARFTASASNPNVAVPASKLVILELSKQNLLHNGGRVAFGADGYLYLGIGDDGQQLTPQDLSSLFGKVLRIDVDNPSGGKQYGIPPDNPFVGGPNGAREEVWAFGFRNPWRFCFDPPTGRLWLGDVGANDREEIDIVRKGGNYGWPRMEGDICHPPTACDTTGLNLVRPLWVYDHDSGDASITGGFVYRGSSMPSLVGKYVYADYVSGRIWALTWNGVNPPTNVLFATLNAVPSFGVDRNGELYLASFDGHIYRLFAGPTPVEPPISPRATLEVSPNPFQSSTRIAFSLATPGRTVLEVYDVAGRRVTTLMNGYASSGPNTAQWNGRTLGGEPVRSGVYFLRLSVNGEAVETRRITLLK